VTDLPALLRKALQASDARMDQEAVSAATMGSVDGSRSGYAEDVFPAACHMSVRPERRGRRRLRSEATCH
jgi:hypothetical protein